MIALRAQMVVVALLRLHTHALHCLYAHCTLFAITLLTAFTTVLRFALVARVPHAPYGSLRSRTARVTCVLPLRTRARVLPARMLVRARLYRAGLWFTI